jgi:hypothetical protein
MNVRICIVFALALTSAIPLAANDKKKSPDRGMLEKMEAVPCGAKERGLTGLGSFWASIGITHVNSDEKLCPEYLLRTDETEYHIRPVDLKHPVVLPIGQEGEFKIKKDEMLLKFDDGDKKTRAYRVVAENPTQPNANDPNAPAKPAEKP